MFPQPPRNQSIQRLEHKISQFTPKMRFFFFFFETSRQLFQGERGWSSSGWWGMRRELVFPWKIPFAQIAGTDPGYSRNLWWWKGKNSQISSLGAITAVPLKGPLCSRLWDLSGNYPGNFGQSWIPSPICFSSLFFLNFRIYLGIIQGMIMEPNKIKIPKKNLVKMGFSLEFPHFFQQIWNFPAQIWLLCSTRNSWLWNPGNSLAFPWNIHEKLVSDYQ